MRVSPLHLIVLAYTVEVEGCDMVSALSRCGWSPGDLPAEDGEWVPLDDLRRLIEAVLAETGDPAFGLIAGKSLAVARFAILMSVSVFSSSLRQLLADIARYSALVQETTEFTFIEQPGHAFVDIHPIFQTGPAGRFRYEFVVTSIVQMLRLAGFRNDDIHAVALPYDCPPDLVARYAEAWGTQVQLKQSTCRLTFNHTLLDRPLPGHDPISYAAARSRAEAALAALHNKIDTAEKVRQWLLSALPKQPSIPDTARHLGMSERSLRRHLSALGTTHHELAQECQFLQAKRMLAENSLSIKQIADALGFSSVTSFHRAFKRWTGTTPLLWRDQPSAP